MISMITVTRKVFHCCFGQYNYKTLVGQSDYYNHKQIKVYRIWTSCPQVLQPRLQLRDLHGLLHSFKTLATFPLVSVMKL